MQVSPSWIYLDGLVLARSSLASLQLVQVPSTDLHVAVVLVEAVREGLRVGLAAPCAVVLVLRGVVGVVRGNIRGTLLFDWC